MEQRSVVVVGAGPAGMRAVETLVEAGLRPVLIDEGDRTGGQIHRRQPAHFTRSYETLYGSEAAKAASLHACFEALRDRIDYRPKTLAWALADGVLHTVTGEDCRRIAHDGLILATGATDRLLPLPGWTLPGAYSLGAAQIALKAQGCAIGRRSVFVGTGPLLYLLAYQYLKAGAAPLAVLDTSSPGTRLRGLPLMTSRPGQILKGIRYIAALRRAGVTLASGIEPEAVIGTAETGVAGFRYRLDGAAREVACDAVGMGYHLRPETQLADLAGCRFSFEPAIRQWMPDVDADGRSSVERVYLAGDGARLLGGDGAEVSGRLAALALLADRGLPVSRSDLSKLRAEHDRHHRFARGLAAAFPWPKHLVPGLPDETIVCRCEAITAGALREAAVALDAPEVNRAKAFSRVGMGRCQGRYCGQASQEIVAAARGVGIEAVGRLRGQAPVKPLPLAATQGIVLDETGHA